MCVNAHRCSQVSCLVLAQKEREGVREMVLKKSRRHHCYAGRSMVVTVMVDSLPSLKRWVNF